MNDDLLTEIKQDIKNGKKKKGKVQEKKADVPLWSGIALVIIVLVLAGAEMYANWRAEHDYQLPVVFRAPWKEKEKIVISPLGEVKQLTEAEVLESYYLSPVIKTIYFLESTSGKNDGCKDQGKVNGFGYRQNSGEWKCYDSFTQVADKVNEWFEERLAMNGNNLVEAVCFYNKGIQGLSVCDYSENFMGVLTKN